MHVITSEQTAIIAIVFVVACASTLSRSLRDGDRRNRIRLFGLGTTSGFLGVGLYCVGSDYVSKSFGVGGNLLWIGLAAFLGFTAQYQDKIGSQLFITVVNRTLGVTITALSAMATLTKPKQDEQDKDDKE